MFVYTIIDIRTGKGYTGKSETDPSDFLNPRFYMKTNNLPIYEFIRKQGVDWFKLQTVNTSYEETIKKIHDYNTPEEYTPKEKIKKPKQSESLKRYYSNRPSHFKGKTHPNLYYWKNKKGTGQYSWLVIYKNKYNEEVTDTIDNLEDWVKSLGLELSKVKWRCQPYANKPGNKTFPYGPIISIRRISVPKHYKDKTHNKLTYK